MHIKKISLSQVVAWLTMLTVFVLPWQTIYIVSQSRIEGFVWTYGTHGFYLSQCLVWITAILFLFWYVAKQGCGTLQKELLRFAHPKVKVLCLLFVLYIMCSPFWAVYPTLSLQYSVYMLGAILLACVVISGPASLQQLFYTFCVSATTQSLFGIWQTTQQEVLASTMLGIAEKLPQHAGVSVVVAEGIGRWLRAYGAFPHPNIFGGYMCTALILSVAYYVYVGLPRRGVVKTLVYSLWGVLFLGLWVSFSRAALLAFVAWFVCFGMYLALYTNKTKRFLQVYVKSFIVFFCCTVYCLVVFFPQVYERVSITAVYEMRSISERVSGYQQWFTILPPYMWFGTGPGGYTAAMQINSPGLPGWVYQPVHNVFLLMLAELGIVGVLIACIVCFLLIVTMLRFSGLDSVQKRNTLVCIFVLPICAIGLFDHYLFSSHAGILIVAVYIGMLIYCAKNCPQFVHFYCNNTRQTRGLELDKKK